MKIWTEITEERLAENFRALQRILAEGAGGDGAVSLLAVVKANAYGHGIVPCAGVLARAGAQWLGVTDAHEGARVRAALGESSAGREPVSHPSRETRARWMGHPGFGGTPPTSQNRDVGHPTQWPLGEPDILVMSGTAGLAGEAERIVRERLTAVVWDAGHIERLAEAGRAAGVESPVRVHLEVDSGMSRQGAAGGADLDLVLQAIGDEKGIVLDGVMTHFASTEVAGSAQTAAQQGSFEAAIAQVAAAGLRPRWVHVGNSSYIDNQRGGNQIDGGGPLAWLNKVAGRLGARAMVRSGISLYGYVLPIEGPGTPAARDCIRPVMTWKTRVLGVREVPAGTLVGYNGTFAAQRPMRLALLPVGYADGLRRELSSTNERRGGWVMIRGQRAPIVGRVSMNLTTVDVTGIAGAAEGDEAVLLGDGVSAEDHARVAGTIAYEILCGVRTAE